WRPSRQLAIFLWIQRCIAHTTLWITGRKLTRQSKVLKDPPRWGKRAARNRPRLSAVSLWKGLPNKTSRATTPPPADPTPPGPALARDNAIGLQLAQQTPLTGTRTAQLWLAARLSSSVINVLHGYGETTGAAMVAHPHIDKSAFTGHP